MRAPRPARTLAQVLTYESSVRGRLAALLERIRSDERGAMTLTESAKLSLNALRRGVIETFVLASPVLDRMPLEDVEGNAYAYNEEATLPGVEFRAVNAAYTESTGTYTQRTESLVILGGDADVDTYIEKTRSNLNGQRATVTRGKVKAAVIKFQDTFINGDVAVDANAFDGLKKRLTGAQVVAAATNGLGPVAGAHAFFDALDDAISRVPGIDPTNGAIYANAKTLMRVRQSARRLGAWSTREDIETGRPIEAYNGIPILDIGKKADGTEILPFTETQGASSVTASIYVVKFSEGEDEGGVLGLTNGGVEVRDLGELGEKPVYRTRIEFFCGIATMGGKAAARLTGVLDA